MVALTKQCLEDQSASDRCLYDSVTVRSCLLSHWYLVLLPYSGNNGYVPSEEATDICIWKTMSPSNWLFCQHRICSFAYKYVTCACYVPHTFLDSGAIRRTGQTSSLSVGLTFIEND